MVQPWKGVVDGLVFHKGNPKAVKSDLLTVTESAAAFLKSDRFFRHSTPACYLLPVEPFDQMHCNELQLIIITKRKDYYELAIDGQAAG